MKTQKMSLANVQGKLSRKEMKTIMAGSGTCGCDTFGGPCWNPCSPALSCHYSAELGGFRCY